MNSTDDERRARHYFDTRIVPCAKRLAERGVRFFALGPTEHESTWYEEPPEQDDFVELEPADLEAALHDHWQAQGYPELAELTSSLLALAEALEVKEQDSADISPFVYVMY